MKPWQRWTALAGLVLALILVPFALWEEPIAAWSTQQLARAEGRAAALGLVILLLAGDVLLPVPSSFVSAAAISLLGAARGGAGIFVGMSLAAWLGYGLGVWGGEPLAQRVAGTQELERARGLLQRHGSWVLLLCRGVPVLAEASTLLAGAVRSSPWRFGVITGLGNLGLTLAYALIGALDLTGVAAWLAPFVFGVAVPGLALLLLRQGGFNREVGRVSR